MLLSEAIEELVVATIADGRSMRTAFSYREKLRPLVNYLGDVAVDQVTTRDLRRYVANLRQQETRYQNHAFREEIEGGYSVATVAGRVRAFRRLFNFLVEEGLLVDNPGKRIKTPKVPKGEPRANHAEDFPKLLAATEGDRPMNLRDRALLLFLVDTGCRVGGVASLKIGDVDMEKCLARVTEKGSKTRLVPFSEPTRQALAAWLAVRAPVDTEHIFTTLGSRGAPYLTTEGVRQVMKRLKRKAGIKGPVNPHSFRHGFAREYLLNGGDLASLQRLMGHSSVTVTADHYAIFLMDELKRKHDQHSPIARMGRKGEL